MSNLPMISETRSMLLEATGWALQDDGEWISSENRIPYKQVTLNESRKAFYKLGKENFTSLEIRDVIINNDLFVVFIIKFNRYRRLGIPLFDTFGPWKQEKFSAE